MADIALGGPGLAEKMPVAPCSLCLIPSNVTYRLVMSYSECNSCCYLHLPVPPRGTFLAACGCKRAGSLQFHRARDGTMDHTGLLPQSEGFQLGHPSV